MRPADPRRPEPAEPVDVCVDAGTTVVKAVAFDPAGRVLAVARRASASQSAGVRSEQDMDATWEAAAAATRAVLADVGVPPRMIAVTAQGDGCWLVDANARPVRPAVLWNDGRAEGLVRRWQDDGTLAAIFSRTGAVTYPGLANAILAVLAREEPDALARAAACLTCGGWLFASLTGVVATDRSDAAAPWLDAVSGGYADDVLTLSGIEWAAGLRPRLLDDGARTAPLTSAAAARLGAPAGIPVVYAPYDVATAALGVGCVDPGQACCVLGTTLCTETVIGGPDVTGARSGCSVPGGHDGRWLRVLATLAGCGVVDWAVDLLGLDGPDALGALAREAPAGAGGLQLAPYLSPAGERVPFLDPSASGTLGGLGLGTGRAHLARAVFEGLTHAIRECLDAAPERCTEIRLCGGGAASELWCQVIADVTGVPTTRTEGGEETARGALVAGLVATGAQPDARAAVGSVVRELDRWEPDPDVVSLHDAHHEELLRTREAVRERWPHWRRLAGLGAAQELADAR